MRGLVERARATIREAFSGRERRTQNKLFDQVARVDAAYLRKVKADARARKKASKAQGLDVFGSCARRVAQAERDAKSIAQSVAATPSGAGRLNLRSITERRTARACEDGQHEMIAGSFIGCSRCGKTAKQIKDRQDRRRARRKGRPKQHISPANRRRSAL